jgi:hypothetical protein
MAWLKTSLNVAATVDQSQGSESDVIIPYAVTEIKKWDLLRIPIVWIVSRT